MIYLDYNATTPVAPAVREAMGPYLAEHYGNPSSHHSLGRYCHEAVARARRQVAALLGSEADEIVFTSGGTESNNLALKGVMMRPGAAGGHLIISSLEHPAVVAPARFLQQWGCEVTVVPCNGSGTVEPSAVEAAVRSDTRLVSIMHANNEIGTIQPLSRIAEICRQRGLILHTDAAQSAGKIATHVDELGVDLLTVAGHKMYAPKGVGALYVRQGVQLEPLLHGAAHERGLRAGTENVAYLVALGQAAALAREHLEQNAARLSRLRDHLQQRLRQLIGDRLVVHGQTAPRLPNTLSASLPRVSGAQLLERIPQLCASTGSACHSGEATLSASLAAIGCTPETARGTIRFSLGWFTTEEEVDTVAGWVAEEVLSS